VRLKQHSTVGRVAAFPSHREVAARRGITGSCLFVLLSDNVSHFCRCFLLFSIDQAGYADRTKFSQKSSECELFPTIEVAGRSDRFLTNQQVMIHGVQILQGPLAGCPTGGFTKIPFRFQGVSDAFYTG
jgi:hypothetical protein